MGKVLLVKRDWIKYHGYKVLENQEKNIAVILKKKFKIGQYSCGAKHWYNVVLDYIIQGGFIFKDSFEKSLPEWVSFVEIEDNVFKLKKAQPTHYIYDITHGLSHRSYTAEIYSLFTKNGDYIKLFEKSTATRICSYQTIVVEAPIDTVIYFAFNYIPYNMHNVTWELYKVYYDKEARKVIEKSLGEIEDLADAEDYIKSIEGEDIGDIEDFTEEVKDQGKDKYSEFLD